MSTKNILATLALTATIASAAHADILSNADLDHAFGPTSTELSRSIFDDQHQGAEVSYTGVVYDIDTPGWLSQDYKVMMFGGEINVFCRVSPEDVDIVATLRSGDEFTCHGTYDDYLYMAILGGGSVDINLDPSRY